MLLNKATIKSNRADWEAMGIELPDLILMK